MNCRLPSHRGGIWAFSLLEVMIAIAIFFMADPYGAWRQLLCKPMIYKGMTKRSPHYDISQAILRLFDV